jgi:hypothetical protein
MDQWFGYGEPPANERGGADVIGLTVELQASPHLQCAASSSSYSLQAAGVIKGRGALARTRFPLVLPPCNGATRERASRS